MLRLRLFSPYFFMVCLANVVSIYLANSFGFYVNPYQVGLVLCVLYFAGSLLRRRRRRRAWI